MLVWSSQHNPATDDDPGGCPGFLWRGLVSLMNIWLSYTPFCLSGCLSLFVWSSACLSLSLSLFLSSSIHAFAYLPLFSFLLALSLGFYMFLYVSFLCVFVCQSSRILLTYKTQEFLTSDLQLWRSHEIFAEDSFVCMATDITENTILLPHPSTSCQGRTFHRL